MIVMAGDGGGVGVGVGVEDGAEGSDDGGFGVMMQ